MAVDVEPVVFWTGREPAAADLIANWREAVGFIEGDDQGAHGEIDGVRLNGDSGADVEFRTLEPLRIHPEQAWMTDAVPWFFVKYGSARKREQGDVIDSAYNPFAAAAGLPEARLPRRPTPALLIAHAAAHERDRIRAELLESESAVVYTLGEEARRVLAAVADAADGPPTRRLTVDDYGRAGEIRIDSRILAWHALAHPGQRAQKWIRAHGLWTGYWAD